MTNKPQLTAVVPAAGVGKRMGSNIPKQYLTLAGKSVIEHTLERLISHPQINKVVVALSPTDPYFAELEISQNPAIKRVEGGKERADSVLAGLQSIQGDGWVLVHDAARPCVSHQDLDKLFAVADNGKTGGILATPVRDTMKRASTANPNMISHTENRDNLWHALTPQFFPTVELTRALTAALAQGASITDEASAIEWAGGEVMLIEGSSSNIKITRPDDLALAEYYLTRRVN